MKKIDFLRWRCVRTASTLAMVAFTAGCSRPTYWIALRELTSSCDGDVQLRILHDPDPDVAQAKIADESQESESAGKIAYLKDDGTYLHVGFLSGTVCRFLADEPNGECLESSTSSRAAKCSARLKVVKLLAPSRGDAGSEQIPQVVLDP